VLERLLPEDLLKVDQAQLLEIAEVNRKPMLS
jgi:hypothetical protein